MSSDVEKLNKEWEDAYEEEVLTRQKDEKDNKHNQNNGKPDDDDDSDGNDDLFFSTSLANLPPPTPVIGEKATKIKQSRNKWEGWQKKLDALPKTQYSESLKARFQQAKDNTDGNQGKKLVKAATELALTGQICPDLAHIVFEDECQATMVKMKAKNKNFRKVNGRPSSQWERKWFTKIRAFLTDQTLWALPRRNAAHRQLNTWHLLRWLGCEELLKIKNNGFSLWLSSLFTSYSIFPFWNTQAVIPILANHKDLVMVTLSRENIMALVLVDHQGNEETIAADDWKVIREDKNFEGALREHVYQEHKKILLYDPELVRRCQFEAGQAGTWFSSVEAKANIPDFKTHIQSLNMNSATTEATLKVLDEYDQTRPIGYQLCEGKNIVPRAIRWGTGSRLRQRFSPSLTRWRQGEGPWLFTPREGEFECLNIQLPQNENWMLTKQPLASRAIIDNLLENYNGKAPIEYLQQVSKVFTVVSDWLQGSPWCNRGYWGDRHKTLLINWMGPECLQYLDSYPDLDDEPNPRDEAQYNCYHTLKFIKNLLTQPGFYPFMNPYQQEAYSITFPEQVVVTLDFTRPLHLRWMTYKRPAISWSIKNIIATKWGLYLHPSISLAIIVWGKYQKPILITEQPYQTEAKFCNDRSPIYPALQMNELIESMETLLPDDTTQKDNILLEIIVILENAKILKEIKFNEIQTQYAGNSLKIVKALLLEFFRTEMKVGPQPVQKKSIKTLVDKLLQKSQDLETLAFPSFGGSGDLTENIRYRFRGFHKNNYKKTYPGWRLSKQYASWFWGLVYNTWSTGKPKAISTLSPQQRALQKQAAATRPSTRPTFELFAEQDLQDVDGAGFNETMDNEEYHTWLRDATTHTCTQLPHVFTGFIVDANGKIVPRCASRDWIVKAKTQGAKVATLENMVAMLPKVADAWSPTLSEQMMLFRWLGVDCLGTNKLQTMMNTVFDNLELKIQQAQGQNSLLNRNLGGDKITLTRQAIQQIKQGRQPLRRRQQYQAQELCEQRAAFLLEMLHSNIFFPFVDRGALEQIARQVPGRVVTTLSPDQAGYLLVAYYNLQGRFLSHEEDITQLGREGQYYPNQVRLWVYNTVFPGALCAANNRYHSIEMKKRKAIPQYRYHDTNLMRTLYSLPYYEQDEYENLAKALQVGQPVNTSRIQQLRNKARQIQSRLFDQADITALNLILDKEDRIEQLYHAYPDPRALFPQIRTILQEGQVGPGQTRPAPRNQAEAQRFEIMSLCGRPEYIGYLRNKFVAQFPHRAPEADRMTSREICSALLGDVGLADIIPTIDLFQIKGVPADLSHCGVLNIFWDENLRARVDAWLIHNYGLTLTMVRNSNRKYENYQPQEIQERVIEQRNQDLKKEQDIQTQQDKIWDLRAYLIGEDKTCPDQQFGELCQAQNMLDFLPTLLQGMCQPNAVFGPFDQEFLLTLHAILRISYNRLYAGSQPQQPELICQQIQAWLPTFVDPKNKNENIQNLYFENCNNQGCQIKNLSTTQLFNCLQTASIQDLPSHTFYSLQFIMVFYGLIAKWDLQNPDATLSQRVFRNLELLRQQPMVQAIESAVRNPRTQAALQEAASLTQRAAQGAYRYGATTARNIAQSPYAQNAALAAIQGASSGAAAYTFGS